MSALLTVQCNITAACYAQFDASAKLIGIFFLRKFQGNEYAARFTCVPISLLHNGTYLGVKTYGFAGYRRGNALSPIHQVTLCRKRSPFLPCRPTISITLLKGTLTRKIIIAVLVNYSSTIPKKPLLPCEEAS